MAKPSLGIYGPLAPDRSGVCPYLDLIQSYLENFFECRRLNNYSFISPSSFDHVLYNIGNNLMHRSAFQAMRLRSGLTIIHEFICLDYYLSDWADLPSEERSWLLTSYGRELSCKLSSLEELLAALADRPAFDRFSCDFHSESLFLRHTTNCLVHSIAVAETLSNRHPSRSFLAVPFPVRPIRLEAVKAMRLRLGLVDEFIFGCFGFIGEYKRLEKILEAWLLFEKLEQRGMLLLVGAKQYDIPLPESNRMRYLGWIENESTFDEVLVGVDCGIQLRHPCLGETSATMAKLLAHGIPLITSSVPLLKNICSEVNVRGVEPGANEVLDLVKAFQDALIRQRVSPKYCNRYHPERVAQTIRSTITDSF